MVISLKSRSSRRRLVGVRDHGPGFNHDPLNLLARAKNPEEHRALFEATVHESPFTKGFGIMLARGLTDEFSYNEVGTEVTLVKRFNVLKPIREEA